MDNRPIGIFDSGVGGLTVVKEVMQELFNEEIVYFGDTARVPYGNKSRGTVTKFSKQDVRFLLSNDVKAVIVACNTASSNSLSELKAEFDIPIFGVVIPGVSDAVKVTKNKKIGVIGTSATIRSEAYQKHIHDIDEGIQIFSKACPLFVPLAEEGWTHNDIADAVARKYLTEMVNAGIDTLVLGCTHYPLLKSCLRKTVGENITLIDPAHSTAACVRKYFIRYRMLREDIEAPKHRFFISDKTDVFDTICNKALKKSFDAVEIDIEKY